MQVVERMPETSSMEEISQELALLAKIEKGLADAEDGRTQPHEAAERLVYRWSSK